MIYVLSVMHSGTRFLWQTLGVVLHEDLWHISDLPQSNCKAVAAHTVVDGAIEFAKDYKTVVPLRHPALIAVSWKKRIDNKLGDGHLRIRKEYFDWLEEWKKLDDVDAFFFPLETRPYDDLEDFTGFSVNRSVDTRFSIGDYPEKHSIMAAKEYLGDEWSKVVAALNTKIGRQVYGAI